MWMYFARMHISEPKYRGMSGRLNLECSLFSRLQAIEKPKGHEELREDAFSEQKVLEKDGRFLGLLVQEQYAVRFVDPNPLKRKTLEVRNRSVKFLGEGDNCLLVSTGRAAGPDGIRKSVRQILAVLKFVDCTRYSSAHFDKFFKQHRVTRQEFSKYTTNEFWFGYKFELVHVFPAPLLYTEHRGEIWIWLSPIHCFQPSRKRSMPSLEEDEEDVPAAPAIHHSGSSFDNTQDVDMSDADSDENEKDDEGDEFTEESPPTDSVMCIQLSAKEWLALSAGLVDAVLRPYRTTQSVLNVLAQTSRGHEMVGEISLSGCEKVSNWTSPELKDMRQHMYSHSQFKSMKAYKNAYIWQASEINVYEESHCVRFLQVAPRFRNRPFAVPLKKLQEAAANDCPKNLHLGETARFFLGNLPSDDQNTLRQTVRSLASTTGKIRIGTTCSGTDIVVKVLEQTLAEICRQEACFCAKPCWYTICVYYISSAYFSIYNYYCITYIYIYI